MQTDYYLFTHNHTYPLTTDSYNSDITTPPHAPYHMRRTLILFYDPRSAGRPSACT